jgi:hypothetical protein
MSVPSDHRWPLPDARVDTGLGKQATGLLDLANVAGSPQNVRRRSRNLLGCLSGIGLPLFAGKALTVKMRLKVNLLSSLMIGYLATTFVPAARGDSEIVIAIRYLQAAGVSHSHLYLYREDGKLLRQLTSDSSGQDADPIFSPDGAIIGFTREKGDDEREFWSIEPHGTNLKRLNNVPDWYQSAKNSPYFTNQEEPEAESGSPSPAPSAEESPSASPSPEIQQTQHPSGTALDAVVSAEDQPPAKIDAPDGSGDSDSASWRNGISHTHGKSLRPDSW